MNLVSHIKQLFRSPFDHDTARKLYLEVVSQARNPFFYENVGVPDTPEGRFDMVALHTYLVLKYLQEFESHSELSQALFDIMFADMDQNMREMSIGDTGVAKRIKKMAEGFYGRAEAYDAAFAAENPQELRDVIDRNVFRKAVSKPESLAKMADYMRLALEQLTSQDIQSVERGEVIFPDISKD